MYMNQQKKILLSLLFIGSLCHQSSILGDDNFTNPPVSKIADLSNKYVVDVDFLYWLGKENGNEYAQTGTLISSDIGVKSGKIYSPNYHCEPGVKISLSTPIGNPNWDLSLGYLWFEGQGSGSIKSNNTTSGIIPTFTYSNTETSLGTATYNGGSTGYVTAASSDWALYLNVWSLEVGYTIDKLRNLLFRPFFGLKGTWQHQTLSLKYVINDITTNAFLGKNAVVNYQSFAGAGLRFGCNSSWLFNKHWSLFANCSTDLIWGPSKSKVKSYDTVVADHSDLLIANQRYHSNHLIPVLDLFAGISFDKTFHSSLKGINIYAGWEEQIWFFHNQLSSMIADTSLILQGLTLGCKFTF